MKRLADFLFEGHLLKRLHRTGYPYLGVGRESVAEHSFMTAFIAWVLSHMVPEVDTERLITLCLVHDLPEARIGDLNALQKRYVHADEEAAVADTANNLPFGDTYQSLIEEFNAGETLAAKLARDADQLALVVDLKALSDCGHRTPEKWRSRVMKRLQTEPAKALAKAVASREFDGWWLDSFQAPEGSAKKR